MKNINDFAKDIKNNDKLLMDFKESPREVLSKYGVIINESQENLIKSQLMEVSLMKDVAMKDTIVPMPMPVPIS